MSTPCTAIQGNADFYGQGIRIGVYLQWLSAWISILTETSSAQPVLEVSSVFVFAILIATITSYSSGTIQPIETYIMLQFAFGFFVTTMGIFGVRLQVLSPHGALHLLHELKEAPDRIKKATVKRASRHVNTRPRLVEQVQHFLNDFASIRASLRFLILLDKYSALLSKSSILSTVQVNLNSLAFLKLRALTWSGVLWRANVVAMLAGFNIVYWFSGVAGGGSAAECRPVIFMVAKVTLESGIVTFYKFTAIAAAILIFPQAIFLMAMAVRLCVYLTLCAHRDLLFRWRSDARERALNRLQNAYAVLEDRFPGNRPDELPTFLITAALAEQKIRTLTRHSRATATGAQIERPVADAVSGLVLLMMRALEQLTDPLLTFNVVASLWPFRNIVEYWEFLAESDAEMIHFSDILKLFASLASTVVDLEPDNIQAERGRCAVEALPENTASGLSSFSSGLSIAWNVLLLVTITWFILSIELTILWNDIQGVNTINSTGQLIPFIIGITSTMQALQTVIVTLVKKKYSDWSKLSLIVKLGSDGFTEFHIEKDQLQASRLDDPTHASSQPVNDNS